MEHIVMMIKALRLTVLISGLFLASCSDPALKYNGTIDESFVKLTQSLADRNKDILVTSGGGTVEDSLRAARILRDKSYNLIVIDNCTGACASYLLPGANQITFREDPLVGFMHDSFMNYAQFVEYGGNTEQCDWTNLSQQRELYKARGLNTQFWQQTEKRLVLKKYLLAEASNGCPKKYREFENFLWLPTSKQLRDGWGLEFKGRVCADNVERCKRKVDRKWKKGNRVVIGDTLYISKGI